MLHQCPTTTRYPFIQKYLVGSVCAPIPGPQILTHPVTCCVYVRAHAHGISMVPIHTHACAAELPIIIMTLCFIHVCYHYTSHDYQYLYVFCWKYYTSGCAYMCILQYLFMVEPLLALQGDPWTVLHVCVCLIQLVHCLEKRTNALTMRTTTLSSGYMYYVR